MASTAPGLTRSTSSLASSGSLKARHQHTEASSRQHTPEVGSDFRPPESRDGSRRRRGWTTYGWKTNFRLPTPLPQYVSQEARRRIAVTGQGRKRYNFTPFTEDEKSSPRSEADALPREGLGGATFAELNQDSATFPQSASFENAAILRACLSTNLLSRALKIFAQIRREASLRIDPNTVQGLAPGALPPSDARSEWKHLVPIGVDTYAAVISAMLKRADAATEGRDIRSWVDQAWVLLREMQTGMRVPQSESLTGNGRPQSHAGAPHSHPYLPDPAPTGNTIAVMARGLAKLDRSHPEVALGDAGLPELLLTASKMSLTFEEIFRSLSIPTGDANSSSEPDARHVARKLLKAAGQTKNDEILRAVQLAEQNTRPDLEASEDSESDASQPLQSDPQEGVPELIPVKSKSASSQDSKPLNLSLLQRELDIVKQARTMTADNEERQRWLEETALDSQRERLKHAADQLKAVGRDHEARLSHDRFLQTWMWDWTQKLTKVLKKDIARVSEEHQDSENHSSRSAIENPEHLEAYIAPFLRLLPADKLALITVLEVMRLQGSTGVNDGMKTTRTLMTIGRAVESEFYVSIIRKNPMVQEKVRQLNQRVRGNSTQWDSMARREAQALLAETDTGFPDWSQNIRARVGSYLIGHLMKVATIRRDALDRDGHLWSEDHPALYATYQYLQGKKVGVLKVHEQVARRLHRENLSETLHPRLLPMLIKPRLWLKHDSGGYITSKSSMMRFKESAEQLSYLKAASDDPEHRLETVMCGLDSLGETPWIINREVLLVMTDVWNSGADTAGMPPLVDENFGRPTRPDDYETSQVSKVAYHQAERLAKLKRDSFHAQRCSVNYKLEIARAYLGERFYFPHNLDFRGRAYPMPIHLNHIGDDLCRGLLKFADGKPLGVSGLRWLRIHLANVYGYDKASFEERVQFALDHHAEIEDAVKNPLNGTGWWLKADDPWQCLATCHELWAAANHPDGPEQFVSHLPVHQDGTCNGLQHYAALGGDLAGAKQVNLAGGDRPSDVYTAVADLVSAEIEAEIAKPKSDPMAALVKGKVTRKVVKQTVMTTVYGVTFLGAKNQVQRQLMARGDMTHEQMYAASLYLARLILGSIGNLFAGAQRIQYWLSESARLISKSIPGERLNYALAQRDREGLAQFTERLTKEQMSSVIWTSPIGLPIVQPYRKVKKQQVSTSLQTVFLKDPKVNAEVSPQKQASAFPPNFIHSLDATHMLLTALECRDVGLTFASVHDSYWTHACDVETMSDLIRDTFIRLHSQDILPKLRNEFLERYKGHKVPLVVAETSLTRRANHDIKAAVAAQKSEQLTGVDSQAQSISVALDAKAAAGSVVERKMRNPAADQQKMEKEAEADGAASSLAEAEEDAEGDSEGDVEAIADAFGEAFAKESSNEADRIDLDGITKQKEAAKGRKSGPSAYVANFVELSSVLPPLPEKGGFRIEEIRDSQYFFS